jgi:hypothetical protein
MNVQTWAAALVLAGALGLAADTPKPAAATDPEWLTTPVTIDKPIDKASLKDVLEFFHDKYELNLATDDTAYAAAGYPNPGRLQVSIPKVGGVPFDMVLDLVVRQAYGSVVIGDRSVTIVPMGRGRRALAVDPPKRLMHLRLQKKIVRPITIDKAIDKAALKDVLEFLTDKYEVTFLIDEPRFRWRNVYVVEDSPVSLPVVQGKPLGTVLTDVLTQVNAVHRVDRGVIRIEPAD